MAMYLRELTIRFGTARASDGERVRLPVGVVVPSPREVASLLYPLLAHEPVEVFSVLCLSVKHRVVGYAPISRGTLDGTVAHPPAEYPDRQAPQGRLSAAATPATSMTASATLQTTSARLERRSLRFLSPLA